jgi:hypothetical protein
MRMLAVCSIRNPRTRHAVVTRGPPNMGIPLYSELNCIGVVCCNVVVFAVVFVEELNGALICVPLTFLL